MGDEIVNLLINLGIEVDKKGNVKKVNKDLSDLQHKLKVLYGHQGADQKKLNIAQSLPTPDKKQIKQLEKNIDYYKKITSQLYKQTQVLGIGRKIETLGITPEQLKAANNVSSPINLPSTAKLINTQQAYDKNGNLSTIKVYQDVVEKDGQKLVKTYKEINGKVVSETEKLVNNTLTKTAKPKGGIEKFVNRVKNIVVYRLVRTVMSAINRSITQGLNLIAVNNSGAREILTGFKSATTSLSISISSMLLPVMQSLSSMLTSIGDKFIDVANYMSRQNALAQGQATYYKINKKAVDDYAKSLTALSGNLSQLDKFATLSGTNNPILGGQVNIDEAVNISSDTQKMLDTVSFFLDKIGNLLIWVKDNFEELVKVIMIFAGVSILVKLISNISSILSIFKLLFSQSGLLLGGIALLVTAFSSDLPLASKMLIGALGGLAVSLALIVALKQFLTKDIGVAIAGLGLVAGGISAFVAGISSKTADSGSSATSSGLASATNINSLMSGAAINGGYSQSTVASNSNYVIQGNVYMSGEEVGQITSASVSRQQKKTGTGNFYK